VRDVADGRERFAYSSDANFDQIALTGSVGSSWGRWRLGAGVSLMETDVSRNGVVSDRVSSADSINSVLVEGRASGTAFHLRPLVGVQYDASSHLRLGAMIYSLSYKF